VALKVDPRVGLRITAPRAPHLHIMNGDRIDAVPKETIYVLYTIICEAQYATRRCLGVRLRDP
jgi:hypothetical protein